MNSRNYKFVTLAVLVFLFFNFKATAQVGIGTTSPNPNAMLDVESTTKGFLPPRMSTGEKTILGGLNSATEAGMLVFDTTLGEYSYWDGTAWVAIATATPNSVGSLYMNGGGTQTITNISGVKIAGTTTADHLQDFTSTANRLDYTGTDTKVFTVHMTMAFQRVDNTGITDTFFFYVSKNGAPVTSVFNTFIFPAVSDASQTYNVTIMGTVELATGDYIEGYALGFNDSTIEVINMHLVLTQ